MRQAFVRTALVLVVALGSACGTAEPPVGELEVRLPQTELPYPWAVPLGLTWRPTAPLSGIVGQPLVFVHLLEQPGDVVRTFDHPLPKGWQPGDTIEYELELYQSALGPALPPGDYLLSVGLYDTEGMRWSLIVGGEEVDRQEYLIGTITVPADSAGAPMFKFSNSWMPVEGGADVQVLARRWLGAEGDIVLEEVERPGRVWMVLNLPALQPGAQRLVLDEGADEPAVIVASSCGGVEASASGQGLHEFEVPVEAPEDGELPEECRISIRPNFRHVTLATLQETSVSLENLSWREDPPAP